MSRRAAHWETSVALAALNDVRMAAGFLLSRLNRLMKPAIAPAVARKGVEEPQFTPGTSPVDAVEIAVVGVPGGVDTANGCAARVGGAFNHGSRLSLLVLLVGMIQPMETSLPVIACSLTGSGQRERLEEWKSLLANAESREELPSGMRFRLHRNVAERARSLAEAEHECCSFLSFEVVEAGNDLLLTVETEEVGQEALRFIFG
jgi:hypothetical protein